jgi:hypothetical protein
VALGGVLGESADVQLAVGRLQQITAAGGDQHVAGDPLARHAERGRQQLAQLHDVDLQGGGRAGRRVVAPQLVAQRRREHHSSRLDG